MSQSETCYCKEETLASSSSACECCGRRYFSGKFLEVECERCEGKGFTQYKDRLKFCCTQCHGNGKVLIQ